MASRADTQVEPVSEIRIGGVQRGIAPSGGGLGVSPSYKFLFFSPGKGE